MKLTAIEKKKYISIRLILTNYCNFKCSYCKEHFNENSLSKDDLDNIFKNIFRLSELKNKKIIIILIGGEITLKQEELFYALEIISKNKEKFKSISLFSNLSTKINIDKLKYYINDLNIDLLSSYHPEFTPNNKWFLNNFNKLKHYIVEFNIMCKSLSYFYEAKKIQKELGFGDIVFDYYKVIDNNEIYKPISKIKEFKYLEYWFKNTKDTDCYMKNYQIVINADGQAYRCNLDVINKNPLNINFKLILKDEELLSISGASKCPYNSCFCEGLDLPNF